MIPAHLHPAPGGPGVGVVAPIAAAAVLSAVAGYLLASARLRRRGDAWPRPREASFAAGGAALLWALLAGAPGGPFTAHMAQHLLLGMIAPLLLVLGRPLTLLLRTLPPGRTRRGVLALAHSRPAAWLLCPPAAALLDIGGLWLLYRTPLLAAAQHHPLAHAAVHLHVLAAGLLFSLAVCQLDPLRHRWSPHHRGAVLLAAGAAHAVLAKSLYAAAPPGVAVTGADLRAGAQLMYYGGDLVELALAAVLAAQWYAAAGRARARRLRRARRAAEGRAAEGRAAVR
ncbi:cytochrome c oxidase assembly protein [Allostreptomyces psammosilenae]|uniref:Putative membrane protein n=1 Tax=Allostreptomyces psammosilenae TaxID=1892865 RepID=A0A853A3G4_9ACTN|nr:cytochrome c oxidase assembly protein [Allostreptomyces psammosilenae]NYI05052.1 putative membrane protein [Allostreptomyces psammosilenae]